jgi:hypothetical protein
MEMAYKQINLSLTENLRKQAQDYADAYGYKNVQELATEALREKVFFREYDEQFTEKEADMVERLLDRSLKTGDLKTEKELMKAL